MFVIDGGDGFVGVHISQTYQIVHFQCVQFIIHQLYLKKAVKNETI